VLQLPRSGRWTRRGLHLLTAGRTQKSTAVADDSAHISGAEPFELPPDETLITLLDPEYRQALGNAASDHRPDGRVHSGSISATRHDRDTLHVRASCAEDTARRGTVPTRG